MGLLRLISRIIADASHGGVALFRALVMLAVIVLFLAWCSAVVWRAFRGLTGGGSLRLFLRRLFNAGRTVPELARRLGVSPHEVRSFAPNYREVRIPKKGGGHRLLHVPDKSTKKMQRAVLRRLLARLRSHPAATGFEKGRSIVHNALPHVGMAVVVRLDVIDFFPSTKEERVRDYFWRIGWSQEAARALAAIVCHKGGLPQGAPTSPRLSNLINYGIDVRIARRAQRWKGVYTRYADDITISFPRDYPGHVRGIISSARRVLKSAGYEVHRRKLRVIRRHQRQTVTGLVVNERVQLPRRTRRWLRAVEHRLRTTGKATLNEKQLAGWRALQSMIARQSAGSG